MPATVWSWSDRWMRKLHLWTGLFLVPWMSIYAVSALLINHRGLADLFGGGRPTWKTIESVPFTPPDDFPSHREDQAREILEAIGLSGAHRIQGPKEGGRLVIIRLSGAGHYRVTWQRDGSRIHVERQTPFSAVRLVHFLHFRAGFNQRLPAYITWGVIVDVVVLSIGLWVVLRSLSLGTHAARPGFRCHLPGDRLCPLPATCHAALQMNGYRGEFFALRFFLRPNGALAAS